MANGSLDCVYKRNWFCTVHFNISVACCITGQHTDTALYMKMVLCCIELNIFCSPEITWPPTDTQHSSEERRVIQFESKNKNCTFELQILLHFKKRTRGKTNY